MRLPLKPAHGPSLRTDRSLASFTLVACPCSSTAQPIPLADLPRRPAPCPLCCECFMPDRHFRLGNVGGDYGGQGKQPSVSAATASVCDQARNRWWPPSPGPPQRSAPDTAVSFCGDHLDEGRGGDHADLHRVRADVLKHRVDLLAARNSGGDLQNCRARRWCSGRSAP